MIELPKFCVFCGEKPDGKTKEHIIPQWLIKMTGDPNRNVNFGVDTKTLRSTNKFKIREFSFNAFQFPACKSCNSEFSQLEVDTKIIIEKILDKEYISNSEINTLLNWFDKVRIGLWLGNLLLDRDIAPINPKFHIKKRMGEKDRCLFVYEIDDNWRGIQFVGFNSPVFQFTPSCFSLCINNFHFFNLSFDFLFSKNIGFPYPHKKLFDKAEIGILHEFSKGTEKIKMPLVNKNFVMASCRIFQPIIPTKLIKMDNDFSSLFDSEFVKTNCIDPLKGLGDIFYEEKGSLIKLNNETEICLANGYLRYDRTKLMDLIAKQVFETQLYLYMQLPSTENLTKEQAKSIKDGQASIVKLQKEFMSLL